jgi:hypothetical protein
MIRQDCGQGRRNVVAGIPVFLTARPAEFLTFQKLAFLIRGSTNSFADTDVLHVIAEQRRDLFIIAGNDRCLKLFPEAVERIVKDGL